MKYEVTIKGTLPTFFNYDSEESIKSACDCVEEYIKAYTKYAYQSVEASYVGDGDLTITIRKIIKSTEPPTVGEMEDEDRRSISIELLPALNVIPFTNHCGLKKLTITSVTLLPQD